jgi:hypothetical protein
MANVFDTAAGFVKTHQMAFFAGGVGVAGVAYGAHLGLKNAADQSPMERAGAAARGAFGLGVAALGIGAAGYAGRTMLATTGWGAVKRTAAGYGRGMNAAFHEKSWGNLLSHRPMGMTVGALAGGALAGYLKDGDPGSIAMGAGLGIAAGALALPAARNLAADWKGIGKFKFLGKEHPRLGSMAKMGIYVGAAAGVGLAARAYMHEPEYEADDTAARDGMGGYEAGAGLRARLASMHGTGDVVLGLHNQRH